MKPLMILSVVGSVLLGACSDAVDHVDFKVSVPAGLSVAAGEPVNFVFGGNPDYITFFSGENGSDFAAADRYDADIDRIELSCSMRQQYNDISYIDRQLVYVYVSTDFCGEYTPDGVNAATWIPLTGTGANCLPAPIAVSASAVSVSGSIDLAEYIDPNKPFHIAFLYNAPGRATIPASNGGGHYTVRPRVDVTDLVMTKTLADGRIDIVDNATTGFGFRPVFESSFKESNFLVTDNGMLFQPIAAQYDAVTGREPDERVWMISTLIKPRQVEPDRGLAIKSIESRLTNYEYVYSLPGTYKATFVATNANLWDSNRCVKQLTVTVK